jgi:hypothetical protein
MNAKLIDAALAPGAYLEIKELMARYKEELGRYEWFERVMGARMVEFNGRIPFDVRRMKRFYADLEAGLNRVSAGKSVSDAKLEAYWDLLSFSIEAVSYENDVLEAAWGTGIVSALHTFPTLPYLERVAAASAALPKLERELKAAKQVAKQARQQLVINTTLTIVSNLIPSVGLATTAIKGMAAVAQYVADEKLGGEKSSKTVGALDDYLDTKAAPMLIAIDGVEQSMRKSMPLTGKAGLLADALGFYCDVDEMVAAGNISADLEKRLRATKEELVNALRGLERINDETRTLRLRAYYSIERARKLSADAKANAANYRDSIYEILDEGGIAYPNPAIWN